ncbi:glycosyltransferase family 4 protein [Paenibacillus sp. N3/727]|uniref:glycosyltransferase family 4 protein n=1 Tax=Paenibacillus sp. N3/727 TaxID=2925845 RepID=UPI001F532A3D|nr:glycosyltransferase family 4 protein [Paenibacillus sp. N3/727]UNK21170.1 glycosyltransferase family 4 protein [Paenibacillus sp. N3/727]
MRIGYIGGHSPKVNERAIDDEWTRYLGEYAELVKIPPLSFMKLFGGSIDRWKRRFPDNVMELGEGLQSLCLKYDIQTFYLNLPFAIPYLLMARNAKDIDLTMLFIAHSVATPFWLKHWLALAPFLTDKDVLLHSTASCKKAMMQISPRFERSVHVPLCIDLRDTIPNTGGKDQIMLAISRIEDVKNIDFLLACFSKIRRQVPNAKLVIAGEYTGTKQQIEKYRGRIEEHMNHYELYDAVELIGPVLGERKRKWFAESRLLVNFSTDPGETFGFNLLEAKAAGLPVVCTRWNGFQELVAEGEDGLFVDCSWPSHMPVIDEEHAVEQCVRLLTENDLHRKLTQGALSRVQAYDYQSVMPRIVDFAAQAKSHSPSGIEREQVLHIANTAIEEMQDIYLLEHLQRLEWLTETPFTVLSVPQDEPLSEWMNKVKPIIDHFAGEAAIHAQH